MPRLVFLVLCVLLIPASAIGQEATSETNAQLARWLKRFPQADANNDGVLTASEATSYRERLQRARPKASKTSPHARDVAYGPHPRNVLDVYLPKRTDRESEKRLPVLVYFHGGGFVAGDKSGFDAGPYLEAGYAVVSSNYRFVDGQKTLSPVPLRDAARAVQFLRSHAATWSLDPNRIAVSGSSAGAVIALWIACHDDLADPDSSDPVLRQSTRVRCAAPINGPTNLDPKWITSKMGGPPQIHGSFPKMFGAPVAESDAPAVRKRILDSSPWHHATKDDPPILLIYTGANQGIPLPTSASTGVLIHHAYFGVQLASKLDGLGVPNKLLLRTDPRGAGAQVIIAWLDAHLR